MSSALRLVYVVTLPTTARLLLKGQLAYFRRAGYDVTLVSAPGPELEEVERREGVRVIGVPMQRDIAALDDTVALARMCAVLGRLKPHIVNASTTKAGLLGTVAAKVVGVPIRVYLVRGLRLETLRGPARRILGVTERVASASATDVVCVSPSLRDAYLSGGYCPAHKLRVLGDGSSNGVELARFERTPARVERARELRAQLGIGPETVVVGFMGRPVPDKGTRELMGAFERLGSRNVALLLVGADLAGDRLDPAFARWAHGQPRVKTVSHVTNPEDYHAVFDVLAFPSYREGFPNVPLEAAAAGLPTVGFRVTGVRDAVVDGETGALVPPHDVEALTEALARYVDDPALRARHGANARERVAARFSRERVWQLWAEEYARLCERAGLLGVQRARPASV